MVWRYAAAVLVCVVVIGGCSASSPVVPENSLPEDGWVVEKGEYNPRGANPFMNVTEYALPSMQVSVVSYIPGQSLSIHVTLVNDTQVTPRKLMASFECPMEAPDGMTDKGSDMPWDFRMFNNGDPIAPGSEHEADMTLDISETGIPFDFNFIALVGNDPLNERFVFEDSNNWYDQGNHNIMMGRMNGAVEDTGIDGKWPMISGNGRFVACIVNPGVGSYFRIKDMMSGEITDIHINIPGIPDTHAGWGVFDYSGKYFAYMAGQAPYRGYLWLRDMETGLSEVIEGAWDGSVICSVQGLDISGDGSMMSYAYNDNPTNPNFAYNIRTFNIVTGAMNELTDNEQEDCDTSINFDGSRMVYRRGYFIPYDGVHGGAAHEGKVDKPTSFNRRDNGSREHSLTRQGDLSYLTVYELRAIDLESGQDWILADKVADPPNYVMDPKMDWAGNMVIFRDQENQIYSAHTTVWMVSFDGSEMVQMTEDSQHFKILPFLSGDGLYGGWDIMYGVGGIFATDGDSTFKAVNVGMWPDNGV